MKKFFFLEYLPAGVLCTLSCCLFFTGSFAQSRNQKIQEVYRRFEADAQLKNAITSLYVTDAKSGKVIFDRNSGIGLAPASTQKIITSVTAFELLGKEYRFKTIFTGDARVLYVSGFGDPTLGSWRYAETRESNFFATVITALKKAGLENYEKLVVYDNLLDKIPPSGWIVEDIGNYYGAGSHEFNWHENQYDLTFFPGEKAGDPTIIDTSSTPGWWNIVNYCKTGARGSGDNAYIYFIPGNQLLAVQGTVPAGVKRFSISGADPSPHRSFSLSFLKYSAARKYYTGKIEETLAAPWKRVDSLLIKNAIYTHYSPPLDSVIYWFNKKSINLYGEALIKTLAYEKNGIASTDSGVAIVRKFWKQKGIDDGELNISDGSGLSPLNRVTTHAQVEILKYARGRRWFPHFFDALPEFNGMKIKSGTINGVKGFCGYHKSKDGNEFIFSFLVNNYNGSSGALVDKMYKVLDVLK